MTATSTAVLTGTDHRKPLPSRRYLMCPPIHFGVSYSINTWMHPEKPTDKRLALTQWEQLYGLLAGLGHRIELIDPHPDLPDMVFAANGATVVDGMVMATRFHHPERRGEQSLYAEWLSRNGFAVTWPEHVNEGEGDFLVTADRLLAGTGFRTDVRAHAEAMRLFDRPTSTLTLVDPRFYHLDTAMSVLDENQIMYYPGAFSGPSQELLRELYPDALLASEADAAVFGLNAISDGRHVLLAPEAVDLHAALTERGFIPIGVSLSELLKSGGGAKCCVLELRPR